jgi:hypothetical protein
MLHRFALNVAAQPEETLPSYLARVAAIRRVPLGVLLEHLELYDGTAASLAGYGITLPNEQATALARAVGEPRQAVDQMLLINAPALRADEHGAAELDRVRDEWVFIGDSHACPACLAARDGAWRMSWKFPWSCLCLEHGLLLLDSCPRCGIRLGHQRSRSTSVPRLGQPPVPLHCTGKNSEGRWCGYPLDEAAALDMGGWPRLMDCQRQLNWVLAGESATFAGHPHPPLVWLRELRSICSLLQHTITVEDVDPAAPPPVHQAVALHAISRERPTGRRGRGARNRYKLRTPRSVALMAGMLPAAMHIAAAQDEAELRVRVGPWSDRLASRCKDSGLHGIGPRYGLSPVLGTAVQRHIRTVRPGHPFETQAWRAHLTRSRLRLEPRHIPKLIFIDAWDRDFQDLFRRQNDLRGVAASPRTAPAREFCSLALTRLCYPGSWGDVATTLGVDPNGARRVANGYMHRLIKRGNLVPFIVRLGALAHDLGRTRAPVDWRAREEKLAGLRCLAALSSSAWVYRFAAKLLGLRPRSCGRKLSTPTPSQRPRGVARPRRRTASITGASCATKSAARR